MARALEFKRSSALAGRSKGGLARLPMIRVLLSDWNRQSGMPAKPVNREILETGKPGLAS